MKAWLTLKSVGNNKAPDELARAVLHLAMEGRARSRSIARRIAWTDCYPLPPGARRADRRMNSVVSKEE
jgi:hypothetical protein